LKVDSKICVFRVFSEIMSRSEASVSPFILRSAAAVCSSASELTVALPTNNRPHPYPSFPLVEFLQLLLIVLAKLVTDGLYKIGQLVLVTARFGQKIVNLAPKDPQFRSGCRNPNSLRWVPRRGKSIIKWAHRRVLEAILCGFLDDCCHTSDVGS
jgi:hypothetical protein